MNEYKYYIGIDVSKNTLDMAIFKESKFVLHKVIPNDLDAIELFLKELDQLHGFTFKKSIFCMEHTGLYCNLLLKKLTYNQANIVQEDPGKIKRSLGNARGKNDKADAIRIGEYAYRFKDNLSLWIAKRPIIDELNCLMVLRSRLLSIKIAMESPINEQRLFMDKSLAKLSKDACSESLLSIGKDLVAIEKQLIAIVRSDEKIKRLYDIIHSVKSIGILTAIQLIISTNEFRSFNNPKKFACYAGVAPFTVQSGLTTPRTRVSHIANKKMKSLLHACAIVACKWDKGIADYYERKTKVEGKPRMMVLNAIRYKLILRVFACVKQDRRYSIDCPVRGEQQLTEAESC